MKKIIALLLALAMLCFAGCGKGGNETPDNNDDTKVPVNTDPTGNQGQEGTQKETVSNNNGEITMEALMNAPESPVEDFDITDNGEAGVLLVEYLGDDEIVVIPESLGITHISAYTFANDCCVKAIRLSDTVVVLEKSAFALNENLQLVVCGSGLQEIGAGAFQNCTYLKEIKLNDGLLSIDKFALSGSECLTRVEIPASVTEITSAAFYAVVDGFVLVGEAGSAAETYANEEGIAFEAK